jgi:hypothetical protein
VVLTTTVFNRASPRSVVLVWCNCCSHAEEGLQRRHLPTDGRLRQCQLVGGAGEAQMARGRLEGLELVQWRQVVLAVSHRTSHSGFACNAFRNTV